MLNIQITYADLERAVIFQSNNAFFYCRIKLYVFFFFKFKSSLVELTCFYKDTAAMFSEQCKCVYLPSTQ